MMDTVITAIYVNSIVVAVDRPGCSRGNRRAEDPTR